MTVTATATTSSTTDVAMTSTSLTPGAGNYVIYLTARFDADTGAGNDDHVIVSLYVAGSQVTGSEQIVALPESGFGSAATHAYVTSVGASDVVEARWRTVSGKTITLGNRSLSVVEVD